MFWLYNVYSCILCVGWSRIAWSTDKRVFLMGHLWSHWVIAYWFWIRYVLHFDPCGGISCNEVMQFVKCSASSWIMLGLISKIYMYFIHGMLLPLLVIYGLLIIPSQTMMADRGQHLWPCHPHMPFTIKVDLSSVSCFHVFAIHHADGWYLCKIGSFNCWPQVGKNIPNALQVSMNEWRRVLSLQ